MGATNASGHGLEGNGGKKPSPCGMVVALIGPDGVGKSSQTARLASIFQVNRRCAAMYLGSGDGGWKFRRTVKRHFRTFRDRGRRSAQQAKSAPKDREFGTNHSFFTGLSGLLIAIERYVSIRRAMRLAASGSLVICDRWPQTLQPGFFDGPLRLHPKASFAVRQLSRAELSIYQRMESYKPDLTIHLIIDFETSRARKPGDRTPADFEQRLALMQKMRNLDPAIRIVDSRKEFDEVTSDLCKCIDWPGDGHRFQMRKRQE